MPKTRHQLQGISGVVALVLALGLASLRVIGMSNLHDESLTQDLTWRLDSTPSINWEARLAKAKRLGDYSQVARDLRRGTNSISIRKVSVSSPLFEWSNQQEVIVKVEYATSSQPNTVRYLRYFRSGGNIWEFRGEASANNYYMNFL